MQGKKVLVTGGAGFIGSHVAEAYLARGCRVWILDDLSTGRRSNIPEGAEFVEASVASSAVRDLFSDAGGFDIVSHHAAQIDVRKSVADPLFDAMVNIDGLLTIVEAGREFGMGRFIFISSGGVVYGEPEVLPTPESAPKLPLSPYGVSKLASEQYLYYYHRVHGIEYVALRYANVYGPRQDPHGEAGVVAIFSQRLLRGEKLIIYGDGEQTRDYVFVGDVVRANLLVSEAAIAPGNSLDSRAFNVGTGIGTSVNRLAAALAKISEREVPIEHAPDRRGELRHSSLAVDKLVGLGWISRTSLPDGLAQTYEYIAAKEAGQ